MKKLHVTIQNGGPIQLTKCAQCCTKYHCPFCKPEIFKPTVESKVRKHIKAHEKRAVRFKEYTIFKCGLSCKAVSHFHCPKCSKLVEKKNKFLEHLDKCVGALAHEDRESLIPLKEEPDRCHMIIKELPDSCHLSAKRESHPAVVLGEELHVTVQNGGPIQLVKCAQCCTKYHCPFCKPEAFKPTVESKVRKHIKAHEKRAVRFKGYVIFRCGLNCRPVSHFHCPKCCRLFAKKNRFVDHLSKCVGMMTGERGGRRLLVKQEADSLHVPEEEENIPGPKAKSESVKQEADGLHVPEEEENIPGPKAKDQVCHSEVGSSPALPAQTEIISFPRPNHKLAFANLQDFTSPCTFVNPRMNRKGRSQKLHVTVQNGGPIQLVKCAQCCTKYHCPFCKPEAFKPTVESKVRKHIKAHEKRAVRFKGYVIFRCGLNCRPVSHFHCPKCCKLFAKKNRFVDHLSKCVGMMTGERGGRRLLVKQEADSLHVPEEEENIPGPKAKDQVCHSEVGSSPALPAQTEIISFPRPNHKLAFANLQDFTSPCTFVNPRMNRKGRSQKMSFVEENAPMPLTACSQLEEKSWREAVKSLQAHQETTVFKSSEVMVNTRCLLELFQFCWLCHKECCITIEGNERMFSVHQDCQSCGYYRDWRSHPSSAEPAQGFHNEEEHVLEDEDGEEVVVQIVSSDNECSEQVFIEKDGSYLPSDDDDEANLQGEEVKKKKRKRKSESKDSADEWEPCLDEDATDSEVSVDEDLFRALQEDGQGKLVVWCAQCETEASLSCSVLRHKKLFCCAQCSAGDDVQTHVRFGDVVSFQKHAEQEHEAKPFYKLCRDCGKFLPADPESTGLKEHKCEHKSKFFVCPECGKRFLTKVGLKSHYTQLHADHDHPCDYCPKVFKTRSAKLEPLSVCERGFKDIVLKRHTSIHSGEKKWRVCERSFNRTESLTSHMRVHTGEKPFTCDPRDESFSHSVSLKNHKQRHRDSGSTRDEAVTA